MGELLDYFKERFSKNNSESKTLMRRQMVKNTIVSMCEEHLLELGEVLTFEVSDNDLPYAIEVINDEPLKSTYIIQQTDTNLFTATLQEISI